jgi:type IV pilus assembly protein PilM
MLQLIKTQTSSTMTTMVIQLGSESTILNIVRGETLLLQRTVPYGTNSVVTEVMDEQGVDATTAMTLLQNERLITVDFDDNAATGAFRYLINNIGRVIDYYVTKNPDKPIDDVFLVGDGALIRGIDGLFKIQLNIQTKVMDSLYNVKFDNKIDLKIYNPVYLISAIGAAYAPMGFQPTEVKASKGASGADALKYGAIACGVMVAGAVIASVFTIVLKNNAQQKCDDLNAQIALIADIDQIISEHDAAKAKYEDAKLMYDQTKNLNENVTVLFEELEKNTPKEIAVQNYASNEEGVTLNATSQSYDAIAKFVIQLKQMSCISDAFVSSISEDVDEDTGDATYTFDVTAAFVQLADDGIESIDETGGADGVLPDATAE